MTTPWDEGNSQGPGDGRIAPGHPGSRQNWMPGAKSGVGCAIADSSRLWFTLGHGIINEIYYPRIDRAAVRDFGFFICGPDHFLSEEQTDAISTISTLADGIPAYTIENRCPRGKYRIRKELIVDPERDVLLQRIAFEPLQGTLDEFQLFALLSPRLGGTGGEDTGWVSAYRGNPMLFASHGSHCLALASSAPWICQSVGFVGRSDAWQDVHQHGRMDWRYDRAERGNVALAGQLDLKKCNGQFVVALALGETPDGAGLDASLSLALSFDRIRESYVEQWRGWQKTLVALDEQEQKSLPPSQGEHHDRPDRSSPNAQPRSEKSPPGIYRSSLMVLRAHRAKGFAGGGVASLAVPWGEDRDEKAAGYHIVWVRDLVEQAMGFLAAGARDEPRKALRYLQATQKENGGWPQNMWLDGADYSEGVQLDESALPILLIDIARRESAISDDEVKDFWPMVLRACGFLVSRGPSTGQDRWENTAGLSPFTCATEIAALLYTARLADQFGEAAIGQYLRQTADLWNDFLEDWTYVTDTELSRRAGVEGYYIRIAPSPGMKTLYRCGPIPKSEEAANVPVDLVISPDALALVRFGLRAADDPRIINTIKVIDSVNRVETPAGPCWHRYNGDNYGEHDDGVPPHADEDKAGKGRAWPLLTGERGHYEVAAGNIRQAERMLAAMNGFASQAGLLPEQVWDSDDIPQRELYRGRANGSAMPLAWGHSEYIRLLRSIRDRKIFDCPPDTLERYVRNQTGSDLALWRFDHQEISFPAGRQLRVELLAPAVVHYSTDQWTTTCDLPTRDSGIGIHFVDLPTAKMSPGNVLNFTFHWPQGGDRWEGRNFQIAVDEPRPAAKTQPANEPSAQNRQRRIPEVSHR